MKYYKLRYNKAILVIHVRRKAVTFGPGIYIRQAWTTEHDERVQRGFYQEISRSEAVDIFENNHPDDWPKQALLLDYLYRVN
jgi:hypothetical protein